MRAHADKRRATEAAIAVHLRQRGSLTVWFTDEAIESRRAEPRTTPGGQPWYSPLAILTALTLGAVFHLALRQTEGLVGSIINLPGLDLAVSDHSTLSRRAATLEVRGQLRPHPWSVQHGPASQMARTHRFAVTGPGWKTQRTYFDSVVGGASAEAVFLSNARSSVHQKYFKL